MLQFKKTSIVPVLRTPPNRHLRKPLRRRHRHHHPLQSVSGSGFVGRAYTHVRYERQNQRLCLDLPIQRLWLSFFPLFFLLLPILLFYLILLVLSELKDLF